MQASTRMSRNKRAFNFQMQHRAEPLCGSKRMRAFNLEFAPEPSLPVLAVPSACYQAVCTAQAITHLSLGWSKEKPFRGRAFYKHVAPNGARATRLCCNSKLNPPSRMFSRSWMLASAGYREPFCSCCNSKLNPPSRMFSRSWMLASAGYREPFCSCCPFKLNCESKTHSIYHLPFTIHHSPRHNNHHIPFLVPLVHVPLRLDHLF